MRSIKAHITPSVLRWARESMSYEIEHVASHVKAGQDIVQAWEKDETKTFPTYAQLRKLASLYKRPIAVFYFPTPPHEETTENKLRTLPSNYVKELPPNMHYLLRMARARQLDLEELEASGTIDENLKQLQGTSLSAIETAKTMRAILKVSIEEQFNWKGVDEALKNWREKLGSLGIWIFSDSFKSDDFCGFYLPHEKFPIIYINSSLSKTRQIFTLFHELGHFLLDKGGIDSLKNIEGKLTGQYKKEEIFCNAFSGAFLVPHKDLDWNNAKDSNISRYAKKYKVSREVILRKYLDRGVISNADYDASVEKWRNEYEKIKELQNKNKAAGGPNFYVVRRSHLGDKYLNLAFARYYQKRITDYQLAKYLGVRLNGIPVLEGLMK